VVESVRRLVRSSKLMGFEFWRVHESLIKPGIIKMFSFVGRPRVHVKRCSSWGPPSWHRIVYGVPNGLFTNDKLWWWLNQKFVIIIKYGKVLIVLFYVCHILKIGFFFSFSKIGFFYSIVSLSVIFSLSVAMRRWSMELWCRAWFLPRLSRTRRYDD